MTVSEGPGTHNSRVVKNAYPVSEGLELGTTKIHGRCSYLKLSGVKTKSLISSRFKAGI